MPSPPNKEKYSFFSCSIRLSHLRNAKMEKFQKRKNKENGGIAKSLIIKSTLNSVVTNGEQMFFDLNSPLSPIHTTFDQPPFSSSRTLPSSTLLPQQRFPSFANPAALRETRGPSFISILLVRNPSYFSALFLLRRKMDRRAALLG